MYVVCQILEKSATDVREVVCLALDIFTSDEVISIDELQDMSVHLGKIGLFHGSWLGPATGGVCEFVTNH
jgi:hypothetical protein